MGRPGSRRLPWASDRPRELRQDHADPGAVRRDLFGMRRAPVRSGQFLDDCEAESGAGPCPGWIRPVEAVEHVRQAAWREARAIVGHAEGNPPVTLAMALERPSLEPDMAPGRGGGRQRIRDKVA